MMLCRRKQWETKPILISKTTGQTVGMTFTEVGCGDRMSLFHFYIASYIRVYLSLLWYGVRARMYVCSEIS